MNEEDRQSTNSENITPASPAPQQDSGLVDVTQTVSAARQSNMLEWSASEYVEHQKSPLWYVGLAVVSLALIALAIFVLHQYTFVPLIVVMAAALAVWGKRPPQEMHYELTTDQIKVNGKAFPLIDFRAFGVLQDGAMYYAVLLPNKRFVPGVNVYFPQELGEQIVDMLGSQLQMETIKPDLIDKLTNRLNF